MRLICSALLLLSLLASAFNRSPQTIIKPAASGAINLDL